MHWNEDLLTAEPSCVFFCRHSFFVTLSGCMRGLVIEGEWGAGGGGGGAQGTDYSFKTKHICYIQYEVTL